MCSLSNKLYELAGSMATLVEKYANVGLRTEHECAPRFWSGPLLVPPCIPMLTVMRRHAGAIAILAY